MHIVTVTIRHVLLFLQECIHARTCGTQMIRFQNWIENQEEDPEIRKAIEAFRKQLQARQIKQQGGMGRYIHKQRGVWLLPFSSARKDPEEGWYIDWADNPGSVSDIDDVNVGDKVADYSLNMTPYWEISGVDKQKNRIYLTPIEPNPFLTGVGAGGKKIDQFDVDVHSGDYERQRVDTILQQWQSGNIHSIQDVAYLLLGTCQLRMGPNGAEGGWYASTDTRSNRGGKMGMDSQEIMKNDAKTLKNQFGFAVPTAALSGELDSYKWDQFVGGSTDINDAKETRIEGEDFDNPEVMLKMILEHPQTQIKIRNWEALEEAYRGWNRYRQEWKAKDYDEKVTNRWEKGEFTNSKILNYLKKAAIGLSQLNVESGKNKDPYWHVKEKAIIFARREGWTDVIEMFENAPDHDNRRYVFEYYKGDRFGEKKEKPQLDKCWEMLEKENHPNNLSGWLSFLYKQEPEKVENWIERNQEKLQKAMDDEYYGNQLKQVVDYIANWQKIRRENPGFEGPL